MSRRDRAIAAVVEVLVKRGAVQLKDGPCNWCVELEVGGGRHAVLVTFPESFPYVRPRVYAAATLAQARQKFLVIPHTNRDGTLCVAPDEATVDPDAPAEVLIECLEVATSLLNDWRSGKLDCDFHDESNAFWAQEKVVRLIRVDIDIDDTACVAFWWGANNRVIYMAATEARLRRTCTVFGLNEKTPVGRALFFPLTGVVMPKDYPSDASQFANFLSLHGGDSEKVSELLAAHPIVPIVMKFPARQGAHSQEPILLSAVAWLQPDEAPQSRFYSRKSQFSGFRSGKLPAELRKSTLKHHAFARVRTERIDRNWLHFRGGGGSRAAGLFGAKVCIVGCGSLGSEIAMLLVREGVKHIHLIDDDVFSWDNVGRHRLGAVSVDRHKADALVDLIRQTLPDVVISAQLCRWQSASGGIKFFNEFDLVINATGEWSANAPMNMTLFGVPVLYVWTEPRGAAGHALLVTGIGGCLGCGFDRTGVFARRVLSWTMPTLAKIPGCGGSFQPYGLADTISIAAMASRLAMDRLAGRAEKSELRSWINLPAAGDGATVEHDWKIEVERLPSGIGEVRQPWNHAQSCGICG